MVLILNRGEVAELLDAAVGLDAVIDAVAGAHRDLALRRGHQPARHASAVPGGDTLLIPMTVALPGAAGTKLLVDIPPGLDGGPRIQRSTIVLIDPATGACLAVLDGAAVTARRTAAASAVATRALARPGARTLGLVGAGAQARAHLAAISRVRPIERVLVCSRHRETAERFARAESTREVPVEAVDDPETVARSCDVLCTLTPSRDPIVHGAWLHPGQHVNAVGAPPRPDHRELDTEVLARAVLIVDDWSVAVTESGLIRHALADGTLSVTRPPAELGHVLIGSRPGRTRPEDITLFNSVGVAAQDMATARLVVDAARHAGAGRALDLGAGSTAAATAGARPTTVITSGPPPPGRAGTSRRTCGPPAAQTVSKGADGAPSAPGR